MRIPFDSLTLSASLREMCSLAGARAQKWIAVNEQTVAVELFRDGVHWLWFSWHPEFFRVHLGSRPETKIDLTPFVQELRKHLGDARLTGVRQIGLDRIAHFEFETENGQLTLVLELMGKHSNAMLVSKSGRLEAAAKWLGASKTSRPVLPGKTYAPPPFAPKPPITEAKVGDSLSQFEGVSPVLAKLIESGMPLREVQGAFRGLGLAPTEFKDQGAYPLPLDRLSIRGEPTISIGQALHRQTLARESRSEFVQIQSTLKTQLERVLLARDVAIKELEQAADTARRARSLQLEGELIMAYGSQIKEGQTMLDAWDYEGNPIQIKLNPEISTLENAERRFQRAKRAKAAAEGVAEQLGRMRGEAGALRSALVTLMNAVGNLDLASVKAEAERNRWLNHPAVAKDKADRPFAGHRISELLGPRGYRVLVGENSEANDYLTLRVAKPDDWWLHVRGNASAHVIVPTNKQPDKVPHDVLEFAAKIAVRKSPLKHSSHVPVDLTLKKYVRRIKGAPKGTVQYSHERVLHVEPN